MIERYLTKLLLLTLFFYSAHAFAQKDYRWEQFYTRSLQDADDELPQWEDVYERMCELEDDPINLNGATRDDLEQIPLLTNNQVMDLCEYKNKFGRIYSYQELLTFRSFDINTVRMLECVTTLGEKGSKKFPKIGDLLKYSKHTLMATASIPFYERKGQKDGSYLGDGLRHNFRYQMKSSDRLEAGFVGAKDAGEPFFKHGNDLGYDFYSFYVALHRIGCFKTIIAGRYGAQFGMGLVMNTGFSIGKTGTLSNLDRQQNNVRPYSSTQQSRYLQGLAATATIASNLNLTVLASWRKGDATLTTDGSAIKTIRTDGYHRTEGEMGYKNNYSQQTYASNLLWQWKNFHVGLIALFTRLSKDLQPEKKQKYRQYYPTGNNFWNAGLSYGYNSGRFNANGETATGGSGGVATINTVSYRPSSSLLLKAVQRFYSYRYYSLYSNSLSSGGRVQNESGLLVGVTWTATSSITLGGYFDYVYHAWLRYQVSDASKQADFLFTTLWKHNGWSIIGKYRLKRQQRDNTSKSSLIWKTEHRGRLSVLYDAKTWSATTQADVCVSTYKVKSRGWMISQHGGLSLLSERLLVSGSVGYFHTDDYQSAIYSYERGPRYSFSFPAFYGEGIRYALMIKSQFGSKFSLLAKYGTTDYFDRDHISSSHQIIEHSSKTDLEVQLTVKF